MTDNTYPTINWITKKEVNDLVEAFIQSRSKKYQAKVLISMNTYEDIIQVLRQKPAYCTFSTAKFRYWARKKFALIVTDGKQVVCLKKVDQTIGKPVCVKEEIFDVISKAHADCDHKGRDITYENVKRMKSYLPKELCDMIIKKCYFCNERKARSSLTSNDNESDFKEIIDFYLTI
ncbi:uncharacterized protein BX663DRAFT_493007 [Cokeromyces recurvatus]|uniref:uncharacterized protein n=1 Tax=Cokeromyces recurvatus TaxID=90255 RepID=UPI0022203691|nr:uncharacterized protein BX663DRAFT_493007 [Cokeromyces recurvatus]KAI7908110.1 hypothetical protein BX663DRAFT_493007 [Cokeromyces recurvatus]